MPTIDPTTLSRAIPWLRLLHEAGVVPVVAANSAASAAVELPDGFVRSTDGTNGGFARSVNRGARAVDGWDWLLLLNDDLQLSAEAVERVVAAVHRAPLDRPELLLFDPEEPRRVPSSTQALLGLALINEIPGRLRQARSDRPAPLDGPLPPNVFKSFSAVAINRATWDLLGPLSEDFLFCYEDAEYVRRLAAAGAVARAVPISIEHNHSKSTKSRIRMVLPAIAESATAYLRSNGVPDPLARGLTVGALLLRLPFVLVTSAPRGQHLRGIGIGVRLAVTRRPASLPPFGSPAR